MKRVILAIFGVLAISFAGVMVNSNPVMAACPGTAESCSCGAKTFLGLRPWYAGLCSGNDENSEVMPPKQADNLDEAALSLSQFVWTIILNVLFDLLVLIGYIALAFVIYGGYLYILSQGDPGRAVKGKKTLVTAITGVVIAMGASIVVNTIIFILGINAGNGIEQEFDGSSLQNVFNWAYSMAGLVAVIFIIKGGIDYMLSQGEPGKIQQATRGIMYAVIGLVVVLLAAFITGAVISSIGGTL